MTSQTAFFTTSLGTDPRASPASAPRPRLPTTMRFLGSDPAVARSVRRVALDDPMVDVSGALLLELLDRPQDRLPDGLLSVQLLAPAGNDGRGCLPGLRPVCRDDEQIRVRGRGDCGGVADRDQRRGRPIGADHQPVVDVVDAAWRTQ